MLKRLMVAIVVVGILGAGAQAVVVDVQGGDLVGSLQLTDAGGWGDDGVLFSWNISTPGGSGKDWHYSYTFGDAESYWLLEACPDTGGLFTWGDGYSTVGPQLATGFAPNPWGAGAEWAIKITDTGAAQATYTFDTDLNPIWGDVYAYDATNNGAWNTNFNSDPTAADQASDPFPPGWVAMPDSGLTDIVIPEPTTGILALTALLAGAFARRRRKKEEEGE